MTKYQTQFQKLLRELFQFDSADLDFGIYAVLNQRRDQIEQFIEQRLPQILEAGLEMEAAEQRAAAQEKLATARKKVVETLGEEALDADGNLTMASQPMANTPVVKAYLATKAEIEASTLAEDTEAQIYNDLYRFFSRYYDDGDFVTKRRFGQDKYALPYNGQEVYLYWANADQYYVKSGEHFTDYSFTLPATSSDKTARVVFFKLQQAEVDRDNTKSDDKRFFVLHPDRPFNWLEESRTLTLNFEYRALTPAEKERVGTRNQQDKLNDEALATLTKNLPNVFLKDQLLQPDKDDETERPRFIRHINRYTARNTRDFFIHKNLAPFLRQELDYFLKNEILNIDDIDLDNPQRARLALARVNVIRQIGHQIIAFLAQIENFQKKLFEKRKFVRQSDYCLTLDRIPESVRDEVYQAILNSPEQLQTWSELYALGDTEPTLFNPNGNLTDITGAFLAAHPHLMLDTAFLPTDVKAKLLTALDDLDEVTDGLLVHSENFQALNLLLTRYAGQITGTYIDPPYNTGEDGFIYKDSFQHSSWLTMLENRLVSAKEMLSDDGAILISIDDGEQHALRFACDSIFGTDNFLANLLWKSRQNVDSRAKDNISNDHEFVLAYGQTFRGREKDTDKYSNPDNDPRGPWMSDNMVGLRSKRDRPNLHYDILVGVVSSLPDDKAKRKAGTWTIGNYQVDTTQFTCFHENIEEVRQGSYVFALGEQEASEGNFIARYIGSMNQLAEGMPRPGNIYHCTDKGWRYEPSSMAQKMLEQRVLWPSVPSGRPRKKSFLKELQSRYTGFSSVVGYTREGTNELTNIFGRETLSFPKPSSLIVTLLKQVTEEDAIVLDFFAGSGTTGHAVMDLNREDGGNRKYILVEVGDYFDTVLKPRIQKVAYASDWKDGQPVAGSEGQSHMFQYIRLESYEESLTNIAFKDRQEQPGLFSHLEAMPDYLIHYMLDFETEDSPTLLNLEQFNRPFEYQLKDGPVDLVTTFNFLLGLRVETHRTFTWDTGPVVCVVGTAPDEKRVGVIWRNVPASAQMDAERAWLEQTVLSGLTLDTLYINGDSVLPDAQPLEPEFKRLMFASVTPAPVLEVQ